MAKRSKLQERRRGKRRENRHERRQQQHSGGGEWDAIKIPDGVEVFKPEKDTTYHIDVIPYVVGKLNKNADEGDEYFELSYPVYRNLGIDDKKFVAIGELLGVRDPVAEHFASLRRKGAEWDDMKMYKPTFRQLFLVFVHEQAEKGLQLFEGAYGTFGELLDEEIASSDEDYTDNFDDPDAGATLVVRFKGQNIGQTNPWVRASKINFVERENGFDAGGDKKLAAEVLAKAADVCLDDCLKVPDYETLYKALHGEPLPREEDDDEDEEPAPPRKKSKKAKPEPEPEDDEDDDLDDFDEDEDEPESEDDEEEDEAPELSKGDAVTYQNLGVCTITKIAKNGKLTLVDEDGDVHTDVDPEDVAPAEDDAPPAKPAGRKGGGAGARGAGGTRGKKTKGGAATGGATSGARGKKAKAPEPEEDEEEIDDVDVPEPDDDDEDWDD